MQSLLSGGIYALSGLIGLIAFLYPFFLPGLATSHEADAPVLAVVLIGVALGVLLLEVQGQTVSAKIVAALGVLVAITSVLRFLEVAIPGPAGFSPIFAPIILAGYIFGARFGFLMGTLTLLVSGLITGTIGPWLPYQMFAAGWVGLTAGWLPKFSRPRLELAVLAGFGLLWGVLFGVIMNLYFWPFVLGDAPTSWQTGLGVGETLTRYATFYTATSLWWDLARGLGNALLIVALGRPTLRALARFRDRFGFRIG